MRLLFNNEIQIDKWSNLLERSPYSSPFQTRQFYDIVNSVATYNANAIAVEDEGNLQIWL